MPDVPGSILFACSMNAVRSAMAESIMKHYHGHRVYVDSAGVHKGERDGFVTAVMEEIGVDLARHKPKTFDDLEDPGAFDIIISLSPEAHHRALELVRNDAVDVEYWRTFDATIIEGTREMRLDAYRQVRDDLVKRILQRFPSSGAPRV